MKIINILICVVFILFSTILVGCFSTIDYEWAIGEKGINTVCDVVNAFVIDDDRVLTAPLCFVFLLPFMVTFVVKSIKRFPENKLKAISYLVTVGFSVVYWYWMFFGRFIACPLVTY
ncbi:YjeO family protein [Xenorhabdus bovienii]|uniref:DUF2645 family protein n=1 Tax=Xenorhabdus bovienii TaxID=40576 RepID=UPI00237CE71E|nr:DUF2645 family protein [Xenorhabdus bovienii]MDE1487776.1 YjeO family protein [Xenorhabdus bovienii]MDE9478673.1 YjeO family protein [Xenorhabdus bovienii]MDE9493913.1 YjeO family protein [Xenorhabdus bovienii]MDE9502448.1 YjeO family protein [Xenorhabdus bovienii]MDE9518628.1 YjeO family protein [Xenorhabdus bovienii]